MSDVRINGLVGRKGRVAAYLVVVAGVAVAETARLELWVGLALVGVGGLCVGDTW